MGLDNYFTFRCAPSQTAPTVTLPRPIKLYTGMLSNGGESCAAFRGKIYAAIVEDLTGFDLYADEIDASGCRELGEALRKAISEINDDTVVDLDWELKAHDLRDLGDVFTAYGEAGFSCVSWY